MELQFFGREPKSVFGLLGQDENSATFSVGWALSRSPSFLAEFVRKLAAGMRLDYENVAIELQRHEVDGGFTDIELRCKGVCHIIVEAKRGWVIPDVLQLTKYADRLSGDQSAVSRIVSLSAAGSGYAAKRLPEKVKGVAVVHWSWADLRRLVVDAYGQASSFEEKLWLRELNKHLEGYVSMQNPQDNLVYVVSLSSQPIREGNSYSWIDVVEKDGSYFHPVGNRWPLLPPNYIGFRYWGQLQSVHHIDAYEVVTNLASVNPRWPDSDTDHFVYRLGPAMRPKTPVKTGNIFRNHRVRCAIDTLLSGAYTTISDARDETNRRLNAEP